MSADEERPQTSREQRATFSQQVADVNREHESPER